MSMAEGAGLGAGDEGRGQPGAFSRLGGVRRLARGERRVRERNKISERKEGGVVEEDEQQGRQVEEGG